RMRPARERNLGIGDRKFRQLMERRPGGVRLPKIGGQRTGRASQAPVVLGRLPLPQVFAEQPASRAAYENEARSRKQPGAQSRLWIHAERPANNRQRRLEKGGGPYHTAGFGERPIVREGLSETRAFLANTAN